MPVTGLDLRQLKRDGAHFVMLTAYDFQTAQILDQAGVPVIFIGDTLGIFCLGHQTTVPVTMDDMVHHCAAVSRAVKSALVLGDLPFGAYHVSLQQAVRKRQSPRHRGRRPRGEA